MVVYSTLSLVFPAKETSVTEEEMDEQRAELELKDGGEREDRDREHESVKSGCSEKRDKSELR